MDRMGWKGFHYVLGARLLDRSDVAGEVTEAEAESDLLGTLKVSQFTY